MPTEETFSKKNFFKRKIFLIKELHKNLILFRIIYSYHQTFLLLKKLSFSESYFMTIDIELKQLLNKGLFNYFVSQKLCFHSL